MVQKLHLWITESVDGAIWSLILFAGVTATLVGYSPKVVAVGPQTSSHDVNVSAIVPGPPPTIPAIITSPSNGIHVTTIPLVVSGTCQAGLTVKVFNNSALAGFGTCGIDSTFIINIGLLTGRNDLTALNYDTLDQAGPVSPTVTIYVDESPAQTEGIINVNTGQISNPPVQPTSRKEDTPPTADLYSKISRVISYSLTNGPVSGIRTIVYIIVILILTSYVIDYFLFNSKYASMLVGVLVSLSKYK